MAIEVFYSYARKDEALRNELEKHLALLRRSGHITTWHDRQIGAGQEWRAQIDEHAKSAQIILLLISPDFISSDYCYDVEMRLALERHEKRAAIVIPIILRPVDWSNAPFAKLQALPRDAKAITMWGNRDAAFANVVEGIRTVVDAIDTRSNVGGSGGPARPWVVYSDSSNTRIRQSSRVLDAALPSHIVKDQPTELEVLIRLPDSPGLKGILLEDSDAEARPEDVQSKDFKMEFPVGIAGDVQPIKVSVEINAPGFKPATQKKHIFVPPDEDSEIVPFFLTPLQVGMLKIRVELKWEDAFRGSRRLLTECVATVGNLPPKTGKHVVRMPLETPVAVSSSTAETIPGSKAERAPMPPPPSDFAPYSPSRPEGEPRELSDEERWRRTRWEEILNAEQERQEARATAQQMEAARRREEEAAQLPSRRLEEHDRPQMLQPDPSRKSADDDELEEDTGAYEALPARLSNNFTKIILGVIVAITTVLGSYWQFVYKPAHEDRNKIDVTYSGRVLNAVTKSFVADAKVTVSLEDGKSEDAFTDSSGQFRLNLGKQARGTRGQLYIHANSFDVFEKSLVIENPSSYDEFRISPIQRSGQERGTVGTIAGRVVDGSTNIGIGQANISFAGRTETSLTEDNGNFRIDIAAPLPKNGIRLLVKKAGCVPVDAQVKPPVENLMLQMQCKSSAINPSENIDSVAHEHGEPILQTANARLIDVFEFTPSRLKPFSVQTDTVNTGMATAYNVVVRQSASSGFEWHFDWKDAADNQTEMLASQKGTLTTTSTVPEFIWPESKDWPGEFRTYIYGIVSYEERTSNRSTKHSYSYCYSLYSINRKDGSPPQFMYGGNDRPSPADMVAQFVECSKKPPVPRR